MQKYFTTSLHRPTIVGCQREIKKAIKNRNPILFVEFNSYGTTMPALTRLTKDYSKTRQVIKYRDGGGREVYDTLLHNKFHYKTLRVCGVNTSYCVYSTVSELSQKWGILDIQVVKEAINCTSPKDGLKRLKTIDRVELV